MKTMSLINTQAYITIHFCSGKDCLFRALKRREAFTGKGAQIKPDAGYKRLNLYGIV